MAERFLDPGPIAVSLINTIVEGNERAGVLAMDAAATCTFENSLFHDNPEGDFLLEILDVPVATVSGEAGLNGLPGSSGNVVGDPAFIQVTTGTLAANPLSGVRYVETTVFVAGQAQFTPGELVGLFLNPNTDQFLQGYIMSNTATDIEVLGGEVNTTLVAQSGDTFAVYDYHIRSSSAAIDAGTAAGAPATDLDGNSRTGLRAGAGVDIGAYEYQFVPASAHGAWMLYE